MSSIIRTGGSNIDRSAELRGLSTDIKPTRANGNDVPHGSTWYNMDNSTKYMYNANNDTWYNIPNGGGGGGTGDMQKSVYDPTNTVANAGGIDTYVETEISDAKSEIITEVEGNVATIANNLIDDTVGWTNKNLLPITLDQLKVINTSGTWEDNVYTYNGITITVDIFNNLITGINVDGANTTGSVVFKLTDNFVYQLLSEDKYYISDGVDTTAIVDGSAYISIERKKGESGESNYLSTNNEERSTEFTVDYSVYDYYFVNIYIPNNSSINNAVFYPMIRRASIGDDTYEPYTGTVKDEIFNLNSSVGNLKSRVGIAESNIQTLNSVKANKSDLGTASAKNSISVVTDSTDLVESGAVKNIVGWGNKNLNNTYYENRYSNGVLWVVNVDKTVTVSGMTGSTNSANGTRPDDGFVAPFDAQVILTGGVSDAIHVYPYDLTISGRPYTDSTKTERQTTNLGEGSCEFWMEKGHKYFIGLRIAANTNISTPATFKPMIRLVNISDDTYEPYHASVNEYCTSKQLLENTVGWTSDNHAQLYNWTGSNSGITFTYSTNVLILNGTATGTATFPSSANVPEEGKYTLKAGTYKIVSDAENVYWEVIGVNPVEAITIYSKPFTLLKDTVVFIRATVKNGNSFTNKQVHVEIRKLSVEDYCTSKDDLKEIVGWSNKNLFDPSTIGDTSTLKPTQIYVGNSKATLSSTAPLNQTSGANMFLVRGRVTTPNVSTATDGAWNGNPRTVEAENGYVTVVSRYTAGVNPADYNNQLEKGDVATDYEPYHKSVDESKVNNTVITNNIETGNYSRAYSIGEHFMNNGVFRTVKATVASDEEITDNNSFVDTVGDVMPFAGTGKTCNSIADVVAQYGGRTDLALFIKCSNTLSGIITDSGINASGKIFVTYVGGGNYDWQGQFAIKGFAVGRFNSSTGYVNHSVISSP